MLSWATANPRFLLQIDFKSRHNHYKNIQNLKLIKLKTKDIQVVADDYQWEKIIDNQIPLFRRD